MKKDDKKSDKIKITIKILIKIMIIASILIFGVFSIKLSEIYCIDSSLKYYSNISETLCQTIIPTAFCIVSIIAITISIQNEKIFGITRKSFNKLRGEFYLSINEIMISAIILSSFAIINYVIGTYISCIFYLCLLVLLCLVSCCVEIPLMCQNDDAILRIIKRQIRKDVDKEKDFTSDLKTVIFNIITVDHNLQYLFFKVKLRRNEEFNKKVFLRLLELQSDYAIKLSSLSDLNIKVIAERMVDNIKEILNFKNEYNAINIMKNEIFSYQHFINRVLFHTAKIESSKNKTFNLLFNSLPYIDRYDDMQKKFLTSIIVTLVSYSLTSENLEYCNYLKMICSKYKKKLENDSVITIIYAIVSIHIYYLSEYGRNVSAKFKDDINRFINDKIIIDRFITFSWSDLYKIFLQKFRLNFKEFMYYFKLNEHNWDIILFDVKPHSIIMEENFAVNWFFSNLFSSNVVFKFNYNTLLQGEEDYSRIIRNVGYSILNNRDFKNELLKPIKFYIKEFKLNFLEIKEIYENFSNFINDIRIADLKRFFETAEFVTNDQLSKTYYDTINELLCKEYGYDKHFAGTNKNEVCFNVIVEKKSFASNYTEVMCEMLFSRICEIIDKRFSKNKVSFSRLNELVDFFLNEGSINVTQFIDYEIKNFLFSNGIADKVKVLTINSSILNGFYITGNTQLKFNYKMKVDVVDLIDEQIIEKAQSYKTKDGRYLYEGTFLSLEKVIEYIKDQFSYLEISLEYIINDNEIILYEIDWDDNDENK